VKPVLQALVLAERVWRTEDGRFIIAGTFQGIGIRKPQPPKDSKEASGPEIISGNVPGSPYAYISLTDVCDGTKLELQFVSLTRNKVLFEQEITIESKDRLRVVEVLAALPPIRVPEPGVYAFEVVCEGEILGSSRISARFVPEQPAEN
jgi:hypothetical protein